MTKKKIVIRVQVDCDKCRSKALKIAAEAPGVASVSWEEADREKLVVTGEVDAVCLAGVLRKKFRCVTLLSVEEVKPPKPDNGKEKPKPKPKPHCPPPCPPPWHPCPPPCPPPCPQPWHPCPPPCPPRHPCPPPSCVVYDQPGCIIL